MNDAWSAGRQIVSDLPTYSWAATLRVRLDQPAKPDLSPMRLEIVTVVNCSPVAACTNVAGFPAIERFWTAV